MDSNKNLFKGFKLSDMLFVEALGRGFDKDYTELVEVVEIEPIKLLVHQTTLASWNLGEVYGLSAFKSITKITLMSEEETKTWKLLYN